MKITNNPTFIQKNIKSSMVEKKTDEKRSSTIENLQSAKHDKIETATKHSSNVEYVNQLQQDHIRSQQLFGSLTVLGDAIKIFQQKPHVLEENIKKIVQDIQADFPQLKKEIENSLNNSEKLIEVVDNYKKDISATIASQKKEIVHYLVQEQNKEALTNNSFNKINNTTYKTQEIDKTKALSVHNIKSDKTINILN